MRETAASSLLQRAASCYGLGGSDASKLNLNLRCKQAAIDIRWQSDVRKLAHVAAEASCVSECGCWLRSGFDNGKFCTELHELSDSLRTAPCRCCRSFSSP